MEKPITNDDEKTVAQVLVEGLKQEGVKAIFGIPGEETIDLMFAIRDSGIRFILTRHEQGAAFMADVYGRLTGKAGVCLSTLGPGATNLMTGVADAFLDGAPLVAITGQVETERMQLTSHQYLDLTSMFAPITKRSKQIITPDTTGEIVRLAFKYAQSEKPGSTHIDVPKDIAHTKTSARPLKQHHADPEYAPARSILEAAELIRTAQRPVILAGNVVVRAHAVNALRRFVDGLHIPCANTMMAKGILPSDSPYNLWTLGIPQRDYVNEAFDQADLVIAVGYDLVECAPLKWHSNPETKIINIGVRPADINRNFQPETEVIGDISYSLDHIMDIIDAKPEPHWIEPIRQQMRNEEDELASDSSYPMKPARILRDLKNLLDKNDIVLSDVGAHKMWVARHYHPEEPNTCLISNGFASMGFSIPGAISAKLLHPEQKVVAVCGDGGFMMNSQELETALREHLPIVILIWQDDQYGLIDWKEKERYGESCYVSFSNPDFKKYAEAMGCKGYHAGSEEELIASLKDAFQQDVPSVITVKVDYSENMKLSAHLREALKK